MKVVVLPRDPNPYQQAVYAEMAETGTSVRYLAELTRSQTLNLILLPFELLVSRLLGYRVLHIHWVYIFSPAWAAGRRPAGRAMRTWFTVCLRTARVLCYRAVWIAHNVLPHTPVFDDDVSGRRILLRNVDAVLVHGASVLPELAQLGPLPRCQQIARFPGSPPRRQPERQHPLEQKASAELRVLFFGTVSPYKGVQDLLRAAELVAAPLSVKIVGECKEELLRTELVSLASNTRQEIDLNLWRHDDDDLWSALDWAQLVVLPFVKVTTSSSVLHALSSARPVLVPGGGTLQDIPDEAIFRYARGAEPVRSLSEALTKLTKNREELRRRGLAGQTWALSYGWSDLAQALTVASKPTPNAPL